MKRTPVIALACMALVVAVFLLWGADPPSPRGESALPSTHGENGPELGGRESPPNQVEAGGTEPVAGAERWRIHGRLRVPDGATRLTLRRAFSAKPDLSDGVELEEFELDVSSAELPAFEVEGTTAGTCWIDIGGKAVLGVKGMRVAPGLDHDVGIIDCSVLPVGVLVVDSSEHVCPGVSLSIREDGRANPVALISASNGRLSFQSPRFDGLLIATPESEVFLEIPERFFPMSNKRDILVQMTRKARLKVECVSRSGDVLSFPAMIRVWYAESSKYARGFPRISIDGLVHVRPGRMRAAASVDSLLGSYRSDPAEVEVQPGATRTVRLVCRPKHQAGLAKIQLIGPEFGTDPLKALLVLARRTSAGEPDPSSPFRKGRQITTQTVICPLDEGEYFAQVCCQVEDQVHASRRVHLRVREDSTSEYFAQLVPYGAVRIDKRSDIAGFELRSVSIQYEQQAGGRPVMQSGEHLRFWIEGENAWPGALRDVRVWVPPGRLTVVLRGKAEGQRFKRDVVVEAGVVHRLGQAPK